MVLRFRDGIWKITKQQGYNRGGDFSEDNYDLPDVKNIRWFYYKNKDGGKANDHTDADYEMSEHDPEDFRWF